jgi:hypothetical protein
MKRVFAFKKFLTAIIFAYFVEKSRLITQDCRIV